MEKKYKLEVGPCLPKLEPVVPTVVGVYLRQLSLTGSVQLFVKNHATGAEWIYAEVYPDGRVVVYKDCDGFKESTHLDAAVGSR
jgi:hypothetical protein